MNEMHVTVIQYLPLLEILLSDNIREPLKFLENGLETIKTIEEKFREKRQGEKKQESLQQEVERERTVFIPTYSDLDWSWNNDGFNYYKSIRSLTFDKQPVRPLISLSTKSLKCRIADKTISVLSATKKIELSTLLISKIKKKISLKTPENIKQNLTNQLKIFRRNCNQDKTEEVKRVLRGVFTDDKKINIQASDSIMFIEISENTFERLKLKLNNSDLIKIENVKIYVEKHNKIYIIYEDLPNKLFRRRVFKAISLIFCLKFLIERTRILVDMGKLEELWLSKKTNFLEYVLASLNPENYSSSKKINLLINHYQRIFFSEFAKKMNIRKSFKNLMETLKKKIEEMPAYEAGYFFNRKSIFTNRLRNELVIKLAAEPDPELEQKERIMLDFLIEQYKKDLSDEALMGLIVRREKTPGSITRNQIRANINSWLKSKELPTNTFTDNELKKSMPNVIYKLGVKELIVLDKKEKGRADFLICLNDKKEFIKKEILRLL